MSDKRFTHGEAGRNKTVEYEAFAEAKKRCRNVKYKRYRDYGGRGIQFKFDSFEDFLKEIGRRPTSGHSLDRIDNNGSYEKGNIRWATRTEQAHNTRRKRLEEFHDEELIDELSQRGYILLRQY